MTLPIYDWREMARIHRAPAKKPYTRERDEAYGRAQVICPDPPLYPNKREWRVILGDDQNRDRVTELFSRGMPRCLKDGLVWLTREGIPYHQGYADKFRAELLAGFNNPAIDSGRMAMLIGVEKKEFVKLRDELQAGPKRKWVPPDLDGFVKWAAKNGYSLFADVEVLRKDIQREGLIAFDSGETPWTFRPSVLRNHRMRKRIKGTARKVLQK